MPARARPASRICSITELALEFDITPRAIRFYGDMGLQEIRQLVERVDSPADTAPQLQAFAAMLAGHRRQLEQQREDIEVTLAEIAQHEARCRTLLAAPRAKPARTRRVPSPTP